MVRTKLAALAVVLLSPFILGGFAAAQSGTPVAASCTVKPRTDAELAHLASTPAAAGTPDATAPLPPGDQVDKTTFGMVQETLDQLQACQKAGNINAVLALYTDAFVTNVALAPESIAIVEATPGLSEATPSATPEPAGDLPLALIAAHLQADGSIAGLVLYGSQLHVIAFIDQAGLWRIDRTANYAAPDTGAPAAPVQAAIAAAAERLGVDADLMKLLYVESRDWPDSSLGCPQTGMMYAQVITPGWLVLISGSGQVLEYHTDANQNLVLCRSFGD